MAHAALERLLEVQKTGIEQTDNEIAKLVAFKTEYGAVMNKLQDLQKRTSQFAYLPFGPKALVPGKIIHTNEVLIHLGGSEDYFAEVSVYQALEIIQKRMRNIDTSIEQLRKQERLIHDRVQYTSEFAHQTPRVVFHPPASPTDTHQIPPMKEDEEIEIRETYDSDAEREWAEKHKVSRMKERASHKKLPSPVLKTPRVSFNLKSPGPSGDSTSESNNSNETSSDSDHRNTIYFSHSEILPLSPRVDIPDLASLTVSEAVDMVRNFGRIAATVPKEVPFQDIVERTPGVQLEEPNSTSSYFEKPARCSRFRSERTRQKQS